MDKSIESKQQLMTSCTLPKNFDIHIRFFNSVANIIGYNYVPKNDLAQKDFEKFSKSFHEEIKGAGELYVKTNSKQKITVENKPMTVQLCGTFFDRNCVLLPNGYVVPLEPDVFLDCLINSGIDENFVIKDKMIVVTYEFKTRLIRENSNLAKSIKQYVSKAKQPKIKVGKLERGGLYKSAKGNHAIFLGYVSTTEYDFDKNGNGCLNKKSIKKATLWKEVDNILDENTKKTINYFQRLKIVKQHNYIEKVPNIRYEVDNNIVSNISGHFYSIAKKIIKDQKDCYEEWKKHGSYRGSKYNSMFYSAFRKPWEIEKIEKHACASRFIINSKYYNMVLFGIAPEAGERKELIELSKI